MGTRICWKIVKYSEGKVDAFLMPNTDDVNQHPYTYYQTDVSTVRLRISLGSL